MAPLPGQHGDIKARVAMDQETGLGWLYDELFRGYGAEIKPSCPDFGPNSMDKFVYIQILEVLWIPIASTPRRLASPGCLGRSRSTTASPTRCSPPVSSPAPS